MKANVYDIIIASLLHDIGKVMQRAELDYEKKFEQRCPQKSNKGISHKHVAWTEQFFENINWQYDNIELIRSLAASHHKPQEFVGEDWLINCLILGDRISSKWDRKDEITSGMMYKKRPLYPIFENITLKDHEPEYDVMLPLKKLTEWKNDLLDDDFNPPKSDEGKKKSAQYKELYAQFKKEFDVLTDEFNKNRLDIVQFANALNSILKEYLWCVPSNTMEPNPTNSLYHHSKTTAAIASTLFLTYEDKNREELNTSLIEKEDKDFILLGGDISGIQSYIFDLYPEKSKNASKTLRARSFKIQIITEIAIEYIIRRLPITRHNILFNAGGKFMIFSPQIENGKLEEIKLEIEKNFFQEFQGHLSLNIDWSTEVAFKDLDMDNFHQTVDRFFKNLEKVKNKKFSSYLSKNKWNPESFFVDKAEITSPNICEMCHRRKKEKDKEYCKYCQADIELGKELPKTSYCSIGKIEDEEPTFTLFEDFNFYLFRDKPKMQENNFYFALSDEDIVSYIPLIPTAKYIPQFEDKDEYIIDKSNYDDNLILTLDDIAKFALVKKDREEKQGIKANAVLKGDVDNLGLIFSVGLYEFKKNKESPQYSITSYTTLSDMTDFFFSRFLPSFLEKKFKKIYLVYAGGDDFCMIGPWNHALKFARKLNDKFNKFVGNNKDIHFSAGLHLMKPKSPIKNAINKAEERLEEAKNNGRDSITIFQTTVKWEKLEELMQIADDYEKWLDKPENSHTKVKGFSKQFLYRLFNYYEQALRYESENTIEDLLFISHIAYDVRRNIKDKDKKNIVPQKFYDHMNELQNNRDLITNLRIPLTKVIYENRKK